MIKRTIKEVLLNNIKSYPVTLVTGARQIGKSTLCYELTKEYNFNYISLKEYMKEYNLSLTKENSFSRVLSYIREWVLSMSETWQSDSSNSFKLDDIKSLYDLNDEDVIIHDVNKVVIVINDDYKILVPLEK